MLFQFFFFFWKWKEARINYSNKMYINNLTHTHITFSMMGVAWSGIFEVVLVCLLGFGVTRGFRRYFGPTWKISSRLQKNSQVKISSIPHWSIQGNTNRILKSQVMSVTYNKIMGHCKARKSPSCQHSCQSYFIQQNYVIKITKNY
jgi:hypothetical protein